MPETPTEVVTLTMRVPYERTESGHWHAEAETVDDETMRQRLVRSAADSPTGFARVLAEATALAEDLPTCPNCAPGYYCERGIYHPTDQPHPVAPDHIATAMLGFALTDGWLRRAWVAAYRCAADQLVTLGRPSGTPVLHDLADGIERGELTPWRTDAPPAAPASPETAAQPAPGTVAPPDGQTDAEAGVGRALRARVAELQQMVTDRSCRMCGGSRLVGGGLTLPCPACDVDNRPVPGWERHYCGTTGAQPGRWQLPPEPGPEVTELWDRDGKRHQRHPDFPDTWVNEFGWLRGWSTLVAERGPLSATPPETAGGGQDG